MRMGAPANREHALSHAHPSFMYTNQSAFVVRSLSKRVTRPTTTNFVGWCLYFWVFSLKRYPLDIPRKSLQCAQVNREPSG